MSTRIAYGGLPLLETEAIFGSIPEVDDWSRQVDSAYKTALEIAGRLCTQPRPIGSTIDDHVVDMRVSDPFNYQGKNGSVTRMFLGLLSQNQHLVDGATHHEPWNTVEVFAEDPRNDGWTRVGKINPLEASSSLRDFSRISYSYNHRAEVASLEAVMSAVKAADKELSPPPTFSQVFRRMLRHSS